MSSATAVDYFGGLGGFTFGAKRAGVRVLAAANHSKTAVDYHKANHPDVNHYCEDLMRVNPAMFPTPDILIASPACQGHSRARGKEQPKHDNDRATAFAVNDFVEYHRPSVILIENVKEFLQWGRYPAWELDLQSMGYTLVPYVVDAADHGVSQNRVRAFIVGTRSKKPLFLSLPKRDHRPAQLDWESGEWVKVSEKVESTRSRYQYAKEKQKLDDRWLMAYYGNSRGGRDIRRPIGTIATKDTWALVDGELMRMASVKELIWNMGFPDDVVLPDSSVHAKKLLGNAVCPQVAEDFITEILRRA